MASDQEQTENRPITTIRDVARVSEDGLSVEIARFVGNTILEVRALDPDHALRFAAAISASATEALLNRARLGLARSIA